MLECQLATLAAQAWLNVRLQLIGLCIIGGVCTITILQRHFDVVHAGTSPFSPFCSARPVW